MSIFSRFFESGTKKKVVKCLNTKFAFQKDIVLMQLRGRREGGESGAERDGHDVGGDGGRKEKSRAGGHQQKETVVEQHGKGSGLHGGVGLHNGSQIRSTSALREKKEKKI